MGFVKLFLMVYAMMMGFFLTYGVIWQIAGHDITKASAALCLLFAVITEVVYLLWVIEWNGR